MSCKKPKTARKDPLKTPKVWEKARREKMKIYFNELQEVLPFYDPSTPMSRFEILQKSKICIKDLQDQNQDLLNGGFDEVYRNKMTKLKQRVKELLRRVDQLTDLLRAANIMIPPVEMYHQENIHSSNTLKWLNQRPRKWTEKINLVVPDDKIKSVLSLIKDYKRNSSKINIKRKVVQGSAGDNGDESVKTTSPRDQQQKKPVKKKTKKPIDSNEEKEETDICDNNSSNGSQSPSQFKENQPVDYNTLTNANDNNANATINNSNTSEPINACPDNIRDQNSIGDRNNGTDHNTTVPTARKNQNSNSTSTASEDVCAQIVTLQGPATKLTIPQQLVETPQNIVLPSPPPRVLQSNTFILTNDGSLVQLPILNSSGTVLNANSNLLAPATAIIKPNAGLLTPIVINKPSPQVIVLQKPAAPIIQTAQILNATPQVISVSKPNVQILNSSIIYTSPNAVSNPRTLPHILSKPPANKKRIMRDSTITTYVNKIPIAALSKHSYAKKTNMTANSAGEKVKSPESKGKDTPSTATKQQETNSPTVSEDTAKTQTIEKPIELPGSDGTAIPQPEEKETLEEEVAQEEYVLETPVKRNLDNEAPEQAKKAKLKANLDDNFFKPIETPMGDNPMETDAMFCNLALPSAINPSLSVSPTAAFLSSFPIVAPIRSETDDEVAEKKTDDPKEGKSAGEHVQPNKIPMADQSDGFYANDQTQKITSDCSVQFNSTDQQSKVSYPKSDNFYRKDHQGQTMEKRTDRKCYSKTTQNGYHATANSNATAVANNNLFDYGSVHHPSDKITVSKTGSVYNETNNFYVHAGKPDGTVQFPNGNESTKVNYGKMDFYGKDQQQHCKTVEKETDPKCYPKPSQNAYNIFDYNYAGSCYGEEDASKYCNNLQPYGGPKAKNKSVSVNGKKKSDSLMATGNEDLNKRSSDQIISNVDFNHVANQDCFSWMPGKNVDWLSGKSFGLDGNLMVPSTLPTLMGDLALGTTPASDPGLAKPSANPKLCGQSNLKPLGNEVVKDYGDLTIGNASNASMGKPMDAMDSNKQYLEPFTNLSKNIFDVTPSNIHNSQIGKNEFHGNPVTMNTNNNNNNSSSGSSNNNLNNNETIILKNIFELPVPKTSTSSSDFGNRHKQRNMTNTQNTFLSVSQLVDPPASFDSSAMKNDSHVDGTKGVQSAIGPAYGQTYPNYTAQKSFIKNKTRTTAHCKYNSTTGTNVDRKYQGYKHVAIGNGTTSSSSYTAEALIRSNNSHSTGNVNVNYPTNVDFPGVDLNLNYFNSKPSQSKPDQYSLGNDLNVKSDFQGPNQNIYPDFNFSSPVPNFAIPSAAAPTDFPSHDVNGTNFNPQNNSYFTDFIPPEYPLSDNMSNSLLIPPCSISLQNPFVMDKRNFPVDKTKSNSKQCTTGTKNRKHYECSKAGFNDFSAPGPIFTTANLTCSTIFTTSACHNLLPVPSQSIPITFSSPSFPANGNISFPPPLVTGSGPPDNYHKFSGGHSHNASTGSTDSTTFTPVNPVFPSGCSSKTEQSSSSSSTSSAMPSSSVQNFISSPFSVAGNVPSFATSTQSAIPFFSLSNPIVPSSLPPTSSSNSLANFNLSTIFPEINQKGNYHYS